jgi:hypothetical protein
MLQEYIDVKCNLAILYFGDNCIVFENFTASNGDSNVVV